MAETTTREVDPFATRSTEQQRILALYLLVNATHKVSDEWVEELITWELAIRLRNHEGLYGDCIAISLDGARLLLKHAGEFCG